MNPEKKTLIETLNNFAKQTGIEVDVTDSDVLSAALPNLLEQANKQADQILSEDETKLKDTQTNNSDSSSK